MFVCLQASIKRVFQKNKLYVSCKFPSYIFIAYLYVYDFLPQNLTHSFENNFFLFINAPKRHTIYHFISNKKDAVLKLLI